ncbi:MAG: protein TolQ [Proteobacteria bacterium]|nr:protein TolQ [Pseudomonadota bacterium]
MEDQIIETEFGSQVPDFTLWGMFSQADIVVQFVMVVLVAASIWSWAIIFHKFRLMRTIKKSADVFEETFWSGGSLDDLYDRMGKKADHPMAVLFTAAMREWRRSGSMALAGRDTPSAGIRERIGQVMRLTISREMEGLERYVGFLATVGATAPFIGLFGTVWGIMNSFQSIALSENTSLAVVAPGIAEALFATALGLVAAIPAVVAYNKISSDLGRFANRLDGFSAEFTAILSRQLDEREA